MLTRIAALLVLIAVVHVSSFAQNPTPIVSETDWTHKAPITNEAPPQTDKSCSQGLEDSVGRPKYEHGKHVRDM